MEKKQVAVLFGGNSTEHAVSLRSAGAVLRHMPAEFEVLPIGITQQGRWFWYFGPWEEIPRGGWRREDWIAPVRMEPGAGRLALRKASGEPVPVDVIFPVLHGKNGEDGTIQGLCALLEIPCVGCGVAASAVCMDKIRTKTHLGFHGVPQAMWASFSAMEYAAAPAEIEKRLAPLQYPLFLKPARAGSSVGISKVKKPEALAAAVGKAAAVDERIVAEETVEGRELECAVLGNDLFVVTDCGEIVPETEFYDYDAKYVRTDSRLEIPAQLPEAVQEEIRRLAARIYRLLDCRGLARLDFFLRERDGAVLFNEPNTMPGFTEISMYPKLMETAGIDFPALLRRLVELASA